LIAVGIIVLANFQNIVPSETSSYSSSGLVFSTFARNKIGSDVTEV
jgi:hypothetical protein